MTIKIDKGIPMPESRSSGTSTYPFEDMEVGDSFFAAGKTRPQMDNACGHWRKKKGWKFTIEGGRTENDVIGARVWRKE